MFIEKRLLIVNVVLLFVLLSFFLLGFNASSVVVYKTVKSDVIKSDILLAVSDNTGASAASVGDSKTIIFS
ncbi:MAG: hypothetical protein RSB08_04730, partial [Clostridia bacterium]